MKNNNKYVWFKKETNFEFQLIKYILLAAYQLLLEFFETTFIKTIYVVNISASSYD